MSFQLRRAQRLGGASLLLLGAAATPALAQDKPAAELPAVTVTAPSPIVRRAIVPSRTATAPRVPRRRAIASAPPKPRQRRQHPPHRSGRAACRDQPVRHGHGDPERGDPPSGRRSARRSLVLQARHHRLKLRTRRLQPPDHQGSRRQPRRHRRERHQRRRASDLGEDHFVPIDPLATNQIEVVRGPAALRYGSTSIGGVVSATNNRIPDAPACLRAVVPAYGLPAKPRSRRPRRRPA